MTSQNAFPENPKLFDYFACLFVATLMISNVMAAKVFDFYGFAFTTAIVIFPVAYILGDILTEVYGYARTRRLIWIGLLANVLMVVFFEIAVELPPSPAWQGQEAFSTTLSQVPQIVLASILAYLVGEFVNSYIMAKVKVLMQGRHLWVRTISSTVFGQAADTAVFASIAFWGVLPIEVIITIAISGYVFKVLYEVVATPITYLVVGIVKKVEGIDHYDSNTNFTPFSTKIE